jgi:hypothetical protein
VQRLGRGAELHRAVGYLDVADNRAAAAEDAAVDRDRNRVEPAVWMNVPAFNVAPSES